MRPVNLYDFEVDDSRGLRFSGGGGPESGIETAIKAKIPGAWFEFEDRAAEADPDGFGAGERGDVLIYRNQKAAAAGAAPIGRITFREKVWA